MKDRLHRLAFYLVRIGSLDVDEMLGLARTVLPRELDATELRTFVDRCREAVPAEFTPSEIAAQAISPRAARRTLNELAESYPWVTPTLRDGIDGLQRILDDVTREAWRELEEANRRLAAPSIPIRIVQELLERLDELRLGELVVDLEERSRTMFLDGLEAVREGFEQARSVRNQIARGAQAALQRGHITTALFDMARAVDRFEDASDEHRGETENLERQLEEARSRKREIERRTQANQALALRYAELTDDADSLPSDRMSVLEERARALAFLTDSLGGERAEAYGRDRREVVANLLQEHADEGERRLGDVASEDIEQRARITHEVATRLREVAREHTLNKDEGPGGRALRLQQRWDTHAERAARQRAALQARRAQRRRVRTVALWATVLVGLTAAALVARFALA